MVNLSPQSTTRSRCFTGLGTCQSLVANPRSTSIVSITLSVANPWSIMFGAPPSRQLHENFRSRRWGSSLPVCAPLTVRSSPHRHKRKFVGARVWGGVNCQRVFLINFLAKSEILRNFRFFQKKKNLGGGVKFSKYFSDQFRILSSRVLKLETCPPRFGLSICV
jgi:hypothetical protein